MTFVILYKLPANKWLEGRDAVHLPFKRTREGREEEDIIMQYFSLQTGIKRFSKERNLIYHR